MTPDRRRALDGRGYADGDSQKFMLTHVIPLRLSGPSPGLVETAAYLVLITARVFSTISFGMA